jgi:outer membrane protein
MKVAFVNNDSIMKHYELVKKLAADLESKTRRLEGDVAARQKGFEKDAAYFQEQLQKKSISEQSAQEIYAQLQNEQAKIYELRDSYMADLHQSELALQVTVLDSVMNFLDRFNRQYKFDYILGFTKGGNILYANDTLDITNTVIEKLNEEYKKAATK